MAEKRREYTKEEKEKIAAGMRGLGSEKKEERDWLKEKWGKAKETGGKVKDKIKERSYKEDGSGLTKIGKALKYGISYIIFSAIPIIILFFVYTPLYNWLYTEVPPVADILSMQIFFFSLGQLFVIVGGLLVGALILMIKDWKNQIVVLVSLIIAGVVLMVIYSNIPSLSSLLSWFGDPMGIIYQFLGLGYPSSTETEVSFVGLKSYDTIKITLGDVSYEGGKIVYKVTKPVAVPSTSPNTKSNFRLPINIKNLNEKDNEGGGLSITNISIGTGSDREGALNMEGAKGDPVLEDTHVWAYVNRTSGRRVNKDPDIFLFEAQQIGPLCNRDSPCNLGPEEEITVFAENFVGGDKKAMSYGWVDDKCISPYDEDDCPVSYQNRIPCEDKNMQSFEFEVKIKYDSSVTHTRTLVVANTRNDGYTASEQGAIVDILEEVPTDGPMDLIINFNSPYILEEMQAIPKGTVGRNIITMTVGVQNGNENSKYRPYKGDNPYTITIKPIGDEFPSWLTGVSGDCIDHENENGNIDQIGIRNGEFYLNDMVPLETRDQFLEEDVSFVCDLQIDIEGARNDVASYKSISFVGKLTYNYIEEKTFFGYRNSVDVDKQFCPDCPYDCIEREVCGEENCLEEYYCPNADRMCCCR